MRVYLDVSCLNRPFDDQTQLRIRLEAEAVQTIIRAILGGALEYVDSEMVRIEVDAITNEDRRTRVQQSLPVSVVECMLTEEIVDRGRQLVDIGFGSADALHIATAEAAAADILLTCDDRMCRRGQRTAGQLNVEIANRVDWIRDQNYGTDS